MLLSFWMKRKTLRTEQMFMLLTRIGLNSKCVVTGDVTQIDLPAEQALRGRGSIAGIKGCPGIATVYFTERDVVRHELVRAIIGATSSTDRPRHRHASKNEMFDFSKRGRLIRRGLASRKTRRRRARSELKRNLEYSPFVKVVIFAVFAGGLAFLVFSGQQPGANQELYHCAAGSGHRDNAALDQPTQELFAKLAHPSHLCPHSGATGRHETAARAL
jgi:hypothetical protein